MRETPPASRPARRALGRRELLRAGAATAAVGLSGSALSACAATPYSPDEPITWDMTITVGETTAWYAGAEALRTALAEKSGGRISLNIFPNEQLSAGDPVAGVEMLQANRKAFSYNSTIIYAALDARFGVINAPFLYSTLEEADAHRPGVMEAYTGFGADMNVKVLGLGESGFRQITNNVRQINAPEDLAGIKIRVPGMNVMQDTFRLLGANPTSMNFTEVFTALQQGTIDGQENPMDIIDSSGVGEVQQYLTLCNYIYDPLVLGMPMGLWDQLTDDDKTLVQAAADEANAAQLEAVRARNDEAQSSLEQILETVTFDDAQFETFREAVRPIYEQYVEAWGADALDAVGWWG